MKITVYSNKCAKFTIYIMGKICRSSDGRAPQQPWVSLVRVQSHTLSLLFLLFQVDVIVVRFRKYASAKVVAIMNQVEEWLT